LVKYRKLENVTSRSVIYGLTVSGWTLTSQNRAAS
jgi:hypothetical protein